ncbi:MAG: molybdenum cofactor guanylyltransferase [Gammaproteobacteria bacterium]|nr:molybdenum cofactor guanylyltransferase [Gammaproteobacteria bacterium]
MAASAVILAGGRGRRMGGQDKGTVIFRGKPLIEHVIERLQPQTDQIMISANRNVEFYRQYGYPVLVDNLGEYWGPLAGIATAMKFCNSELLLTAPCDTPFLPTDLLTRLSEALGETGDLAMAEDNLRIHPVIALLRCRLHDRLITDLGQGERKVMNWMQSQQWSTASFNDQSGLFANINSPDDLD